MEDIGVEHKRIKRRGKKLEGGIMKKEIFEKKKERPNFEKIEQRGAKKVKFQELEEKLDNRIKVGGKRTTLTFLLYIFLFIALLLILSVLIIKYVL